MARRCVFPPEKPSSPLATALCLTISIYAPTNTYLCLYLYIYVSMDRSHGTSNQTARRCVIPTSSPPATALCLTIYIYTSTNTYLCLYLYIYVSIDRTHVRRRTSAYAPPSPPRCA